MEKKVISIIINCIVLLNIYAKVGSFHFFPINEYKATQKGVCAKFKCEPLQEYCAVSSLEGGLKVSINSICTKDKEFCDIGGDDPNEIFYSHQVVKAKCKAISTVLESKRYPGEECSKNEDCIDIDEIRVTDKCVNNICVGKKQDQRCKSTEACLAGYYCDSKTNRCAKQKEEYDTCKSSYECQNGLLCYKKQCRDVYFSLPVGTVVEQEDVNSDYYCEYGINVNGVCAKLNLKSNDEAEPQACGTHNVCEYNYEPASLGKVTLPCECGYNTDGLSYCPLSHNYKDQVWHKYFTLLKLKYNNECHTYSRFNCYQNYELLKGLISDAKEEMIRGSRYFNAVDCAADVFKNLN